MRDVSCYETTTSTLVDDALCTDFKPDDVESCNEVKYLRRDTTKKLMIFQPFQLFEIYKYVEPLYGVGVDTLDALFLNVRIRYQNTRRQVP